MAGKISMLSYISYKDGKIYVKRRLANNHDTSNDEGFFNIQDVDDSWTNLEKGPVSTYDSAYIYIRNHGAEDINIRFDGLNTKLTLAQNEISFFQVYTGNAPQVACSAGKTSIVEYFICE